MLDKSEHVLTSPQIRRTANALGGLAAAAVGGGNGGVELHFHNAPKVASQTESDNGNGGRRIDIVFLERLMDGKMAAMIGSGRSQTNKALERNYGLDRTRGLGR